MRIASTILPEVRFVSAMILFGNLQARFVYGGSTSRQRTGVYRTPP